MNSEWNMGGRAALLAAALCVAGGLAATPSVVSAQGQSDAAPSTGAANGAAGTDQGSGSGDAKAAADGAQIFKTAGCNGCHGIEGGGGMGPKLAGDANLGDTAFVAHRILFGAGNMPAFKDTLSPEEIAAVGSYVRNSWGNQYGDVTVDQVNEQAKAGQSGGESKPKVLEPAS